MNIDLTDSEIIILLNASDPKAFEFVYELYAEQMYQHAYNMLREEEPARDAVQDVFEKMLLQRGRINPETKLRFWLHACIRNRVISLIRKEQVRSNHLDDLVRFSLDIQCQDDQLDLDQELLRQVDAAIERLPEEMRRTVELRWRAAMKPDEIATTTRKSINTIRNQIYRALKILKDQLRQEMLLAAMMICKFLH